MENHVKHFVFEKNGKAIAAIGVPDDEAEAFTGSNVRPAKPDESEKLEASRSRADHSLMSSDPHRWITML
jgi:hypothetical protein